jgi:hypothetical protein
MMLLAIPFSDVGQLYQDLPALSKKHPVAPLFFMDDHILILVYNKDKDLGEK